MKKQITAFVCSCAAAALLCGCSGGMKFADSGLYPAGESYPLFSDGENYLYDTVVEQGFSDTETAPSSYFSLDRNTAGYSLVRTQLRQGVKISPESVRLEELVNYFDYDYPAPEAGEAVGVSAYLSDCPWNAEHKLMTVGIKTEETVRTGDANYVLLVDVSGSMGGTVAGTEGQSRLDLVKYGANKLLDTLGAQDRVSIVTYASGVKTVLESTAATEENKPAIRNAINKLSSYGSTNGSDGLQRAYEQAEAHRAENGNNRIIILSDGDFNVGISNQDELKEFIQEKAKSGIALSVVGGAQDRVSIVTYASGVKTVLESTAATEENKPAIRNAINKLSSYGSTNGSDGLQRAYEQAEAHRAENGNNRIIILSDGDFNVGISNQDELKEFIQEKAKSGIALSVVGVGMGNLRDDFMQTLALNGNGNYCYIDTPLEAQKVFVEEVAGTLYTVAKDAKAGVTFNADAVSSYRLLGYDMKTMSEEDFNNTEKDAGEIGSNLCVTAMYEIELSDADTDAALAEAAVRYKNEAGEDCEVTLTVTGQETATQDVQFAACVAEFALVLRASAYRGNASLENVLARLEGMSAYLAEDVYKSEFAELAAVAKASGYYNYGPAELPEEVQEQPSEETPEEPSEVSDGVSEGESAE